MKMPTSALAVLLALAVSTVNAHDGDKHKEGKHASRSYNAADAEQKDFGIAGNPKKAGRTVKITMSDKMRFTPDRVSVRQGETIRFVIANQGKMFHEMVIGTEQDLRDHAALMKKFPDMEHDEPHQAHVNAGTRTELVWTFNRAGEFAFACLVPGHSEAGMTGKIIVSKK